MVRNLPPHDAILERLQDQRDHFKIQLSLAAEAGDIARIEELRASLAQIEKQITARHRLS
jgi:hypothetical protein